jgi:protein O-mannosyl-transferase
VKGKPKQRPSKRTTARRDSPVVGPRPAGMEPAPEAIPTGDQWDWLSRAWNRGWLPALLIVAGVLLAYQPVWQAGYIWDDNVYVTDNPLLTAPDGLWRIWFSLDSPSQYFPLVYTSFRVEHAFWGFNPAGYHWVNLLLHAANALLLWRLLKRLSLPGAWLAAAVFALHPVNVESVAWITERKNVLCLFFSLLTVRSWVEFVERGPGWRYYWLALAFYPWALFSKTTACALPAALLVVLWLKGRPVTRRRVAEVVPFLVMGVLMGLVTMWWERFHNGTEGAQFSLGLIERVLVAGRAVWFYLGKLVWPANLTFSYPHWDINPARLTAYGWLLAGAGLGAAIYFMRRRTGRGLETALIYYVATLSPMLGFIMLFTFRYTYVADHYQYVAMIGPVALAAAGLTLALGRYGKGKPWLLPGVGAALLLALGILTWRQSTMYRDIRTLWEVTLARNPDSSLAHNNYGHILFETGHVDEAIYHFQRAVEIQPGFAQARASLGMAYFKKGKMDEAIAALRESLAMEPGGPGVRTLLASALLEKGQVDEAMAQFQEAMLAAPESPQAWAEAGDALLKAGRVDDAIPYFQKSLQLQPRQAGVHNSLGNSWLKRGKAGEATAEFQKAVELEPNDPSLRRNLGIILFQTGQVGEAIVQFQKALEIEPNSAQTRNNLGTAFLQTGRVDEAAAQFQKALEIEPGYARALDNLAHLAWVLATSPEASRRNGAKALELARQADGFAGGKSPAILSVLAAAYAEAGKFPEALTNAQKALQLAEAQSNRVLVDALQTQIKAYEAGQPFRDSGPERR